MDSTLYALTRCLILLAIAIPIQANEQWWLGDFDGKRTALVERGINPYLNYQGEIAANLHGGFNDDNTLRYADQFALGGYFDGEKLWGWSNTEARIHTTFGYGRDLTKDRIQDSRQPMIAASVQEVWSSLQQWRLGSFWIRKYTDDNRWDFKIGKIAEGEDFASAGCYFQNLALCGALVGHGTYIWYNNPRAMWAVRLKYKPSDNWQFQYGVFQHNPSLLTNDERFSFKFSGGLGFMHLAESHWKTTIGPHQLAGNYWLGTYLNTADYNDVYYDIHHQSQAVTQDAFYKHSRRQGIYFLFNQQLIRFGNDNRRGLLLLFHTAANDRKTATVDRQLQIGVRLKGPFASRPQDDIAFAVARLHVNERRNDHTRERNIMNGISNYNDPLYIPEQDAEYAAELHYMYRPTPAITLKPNIQYLKNPGGVEEVDSAWVAGLSLGVKF
jgi:porin